MICNSVLGLGGTTRCQRLVAGLGPWLYSNLNSWTVWLHVIPAATSDITIPLMGIFGGASFIHTFEEEGKVGLLAIRESTFKQLTFGGRWGWRLVCWASQVARWGSHKGCRREASSPTEQ